MLNVSEEDDSPETIVSRRNSHWDKVKYGGCGSTLHIFPDQVGIVVHNAAFTKHFSLLSLLLLRIFFLQHST
jgi:hypothetical protein